MLRLPSVGATETMLMAAAAADGVTRLDNAAVEPEVLDFVVSTAIDKKVGARGLRSICEKIFTEAMYEAPSSEEKVYTVTLDFAKSVL